MQRSKTGTSANHSFLTTSARTETIAIAPRVGTQCCCRLVDPDFPPTPGPAGGGISTLTCVCSCSEGTGGMLELQRIVPGAMLWCCRLLVGLCEWSTSMILLDKWHE